MSMMGRIKERLGRSRALYALAYPVHRAARRALMRSAQVMRGVNPKKVVFSSFKASCYNDNPRYISEKLHAMCPESEIVWLFRGDLIDRVAVPDYVRKARAVSREGLVEMATARFWVDNFNQSDSVYLNTRKQYYINTWHGDRGFKKVGDDNEKGSDGVARKERDCAMMIAGSEFGASTYRTAFHFAGEVLIDGCPRNDILLSDDGMLATEYRRRLDIPDGVKLLMYAPTYRDSLEHAGLRQDSALDIPRTLDFLEKRTGERWLCLYRAHYISAGLNVQADPRVRDVTSWPEMAELLLISDMLITDYSSCGGDFALLRRPVFLYQPDAADYLANSRDFYFRMEDSPFLVAHDQAELELLIAHTDAAAARENCEALDRFFGTTETGHAAEAVCRYIMARMG